MKDEITIGRATALEIMQSLRQLYIVKLREIQSDCTTDFANIEREIQKNSIENKPYTIGGTVYLDSITKCAESAKRAHTQQVNLYRELQELN